MRPPKKNPPRPSADSSQRTLTSYFNTQSIARSIPVLPVICTENKTYKQQSILTYFYTPPHYPSNVHVAPYKPTSTKTFNTDCV